MANDQIPPGVVVEPDMTDAELAAEMSGKPAPQSAPINPIAAQITPEQQAILAGVVAKQQAPGMPTAHEVADQNRRWGPAPFGGDYQQAQQQKEQQTDDLMAQLPAAEESPEDQVAREVATTPAEAPIAKELVKQAATPTMVEVQSSLETKLAPVRQQIADNEAQKMADAELQKYMQQEQERQLRIQEESKRLEDKINNEVRAKSLGEVLRNGSWGQRFLAVLALGLGAGAQATGSKTNPALDMIDKEVDYQAQKDKLNNEQRIALKAQLIQSSQNIIGAAQKRFENSITQQKLQLQFDELEQERMKALAKLQAGTQDMAALQFLTEQQVEVKDQIQGSPAEKAAIEANNKALTKALQVYAAQKPEKAQEMTEKRIVLPNGKLKFAPASVGQVGKFNEARADLEGGKKIVDRVLAAARSGSMIDPRDRAQLQSDLIALSGRLRQTYLGPGAMTQQEYDRLYQAIGDPSKIFSLTPVEIAKLNSVKANMDIDLEERARNVAGLNEWPLSKEAVLVKLYRSQGYSPREAGDMAYKVVNAKKKK